jgi:excisionase family DNA binding protein
VKKIQPNPLGDRVAYSVDEVRVLANLGRDSLYKAINSGRLPARKVGRRTLVLATDLRRYLESLPVIGGEAGAAAGQKPGPAA